VCTEKHLLQVVEGLIGAERIMARRLKGVLATRQNRIVEAISWGYLNVDLGTLPTWNCRHDLLNKSRTDRVLTGSPTRGIRKCRDRIDSNILWGTHLWTIDNVKRLTQTGESCIH
jgi:hypothetical protein